MTPATESSVEVESATLCAISAITALNITQPETDSVDRCGKHTDCDTSDYENKPYMTSIQQPPAVTNQARCIRMENAEALTFFGVLKDPINGRQVVVSDSPSWSFNIPIQRRPFFGFGPIATGRCSDMTKAGARSITRALFSQVSCSTTQELWRWRNSFW